MKTYEISEQALNVLLKFLSQPVIRCSAHELHDYLLQVKLEGDQVNSDETEEAQEEK